MSGAQESGPFTARRMSMGNWPLGSVPSAEHALAYGRLLRSLAKAAA
jgi:hypothetical protein